MRLYQATLAVAMAMANGCNSNVEELDFWRSIAEAIHSDTGQNPTYNFNYKPAVGNIL